LDLYIKKYYGSAISVPIYLELGFIDMIPFIDLQDTVGLIKPDVLSDWSDVLEKQAYIGGSHVKNFESELEQNLNVKSALTCANGTDALLIALQAVGVQAGDYVAIPNLTFWATYEAVGQLGAKVILIDINPEDLQMSFDEFKQAFEKYRFKAAILVHLMGWASAQIADFRQYCVMNEISLIEDGAQSYGVKIANNEHIYSNAFLATLSFYPAKVFGGCMDGGAIVSTSASLIDKCRSLCNHGRSAHYSYKYLGWNSRMGGLQAAFLSRTIKHVDRMLESRRKSFQKYLELLDNKTSALKCFSPPENVIGNGYLAVFGIQKKSISNVVEFLKFHGVGTGRVYPETMDQQELAKNAHRVSDLNHSKNFCEQVLNLPLFYGIKMEQVEQSAKILLEALA